MSKLTNSQRDLVNEVSHGTRKVALGTKFAGMQALEQTTVEAVAGKVNTNYALIDDCEALTMATFSTAAVFKNVLDTGVYRKGAGSNKLESLSTVAAGDKVYQTISSADYHSSDTIGCYMKADRNLSAGDIRLYIKDNVAGDQFVNAPALTAGVWKWCEFTISGLTTTAVVRYGFERHAAKIFNVNVDQMVRFLTTNTVVLSQTPIVRSDLTTALFLFGPLSAAASSNASVVLAEYTGYMVGIDAKRIIFMTDQSTYSYVALYNY